LIVNIVGAQLIDNYHIWSPFDW